MAKLLKSVVFVGPDRCWKSTFGRMIAHQFNVELYSGRRGTERLTGTKLFHERPQVYDRGIVCARAYDVLFRRLARSEIDYIYCEAMMRMSGSIYIFMDRDDFTNVHDEKDKLTAEDLTRLSSIYKQLLSNTCVRFARFVVEDDTGTDSDKLNAMFNEIMRFIVTTGAGIVDADKEETDD